MNPCPCCSGNAYGACCKPYHDGAPAPSALALMRSRYAAYALGKVDYILKTTHPKSVYFEKDRKKWEQAIRQFSQSTEFTRLEIVDSGENWVSFIAHLKQGERAFLLKEKSHFEKIDGKWLYLSGEIS